MSTPITLPDGTKCYSGPNCKRHGSHGKISSKNDLNNKLNEIAPLEHDERFQPIHHRRIAVNLHEERYKQHLEDSKAFAAMLTPEELDAVKKYTGHWYKDVIAYTYGLERPHGYLMKYPDDEDYKLMYGRGRTQDDNEWREQVETIITHMDNATKKWNKVSEPRVIYRAAVVHGETSHYQSRIGVTEEQLDNFLSKNFDLGRTFYRKTITSATLDPVVAVNEFLPEGTSRNGSGIIMEYHTRKGIPISKEAGTSSAMKEELEILIPPKTEYKVVNVHKNVPFTINAEQHRYLRGANPDKWGRIRAQKVTVIQVVEV